MLNFRLLSVLLILVFANTGQAFSINAVPQLFCDEVSVLLSEDNVNLSTPFLTTVSNNFYNYEYFSSKVISTDSDIRLLTKANAYYSSSRLLKPGLSPSDIIFPFHTFL